MGTGHTRVIWERGSVSEDEVLGKTVLGNTEEIEKILKQYSVDGLIVCASGDELGRVREVFEPCEREGIQVRLYAELCGELARKITIDQIYGLNIMSVSTVAYNEWALYTKRLLDISLSGMLLVILSPMFLIIALLIKVTSKGPVLYEWHVVGVNKRAFKSYKFRTMVVEADHLKKDLWDRNEMNGPVFKVKDDPRVTWVGRILRRFSIDEFPQLWSVLRGDMSLVGPRPVFPLEWEHFEEWQRRKLSVTPGMICLWHIRGKPKEFSEWIKLDLEYIDNWSLWLDIKLLFGAAWYVLSGRNY